MIVILVFLSIEYKKWNASLFSSETMHMFSIIKTGKGAEGGLT